MHPTWRAVWLDHIWSGHRTRNGKHLRSGGPTITGHSIKLPYQPFEPKKKYMCWDNSTDRHATLLHLRSASEVEVITKKNKHKKLIIAQMCTLKGRATGRQTTGKCDRQPSGSFWTPGTWRISPFVKAIRRLFRKYHPAQPIQKNLESSKGLTVWQGIWANIKINE